MSKYIWQLKESDISPEISWEIIAQVYSNARINFCVLCLTEKLKIIDLFDDSRLLNIKSELINACSHENRLLLKSFERNSKTNDNIDWHSFWYLFCFINVFEYICFE